MRLLALLALCLFTVSASAQTVSVLGFEGVEGVEVRVGAPWPETVTKGYHPLQVTVDNVSDQDHEVEFVIQDFREDVLRIEDAVLAPAGATTRLTIPVPLDFPYRRQLYMELTCDGEDASTDLFGGASHDAGVHDVLVVSEHTFVAAVVEGWNQRFAPAAAATGSPAHRGRSEERYRNLGYYQDFHWESEASVKFAARTFEQADVAWRYFTAFDLVVLDLDRGLPPDSLVRALVAWARHGGEVLVTGGEATALVRGLAPLVPYLEDRFVLDLGTAGRAYQCGVGRLFVVRSDALFDDPRLRAIVERELRLERRTEWTPSPRGSRLAAEQREPELPGVGVLPYKAFIVLMILFGVLVWPLNFLYVKRRGQPVLMLVTVPLIALGASVCVLSYGLFGQGIDTVVRSHSVAVLDQRSGALSVAEARATFSGWAPGRGFVPMPGTAVLDLDARSFEGPSTVYRIDRIDGEERYLAAYLPSRQQVRHAVLSERTSRLRLDVDGDRVTNGLDVAVDELVVRGFDGSWYSSGERLEAGASATLTRSDARPTGLTDLAFDGSDGHELPLGTYAARLAESGFTDWGGLDVEEDASEHHVLGILAEVGR